MAEPPRKRPGNPHEQFIARDEAEARADRRALEDVLYAEKVEMYKAMRSAIKAITGDETSNATAHQAPETETTPKLRRASATVTNQLAARRMQEYINSKGLGQEEFARAAQTTARTLLSFRKTGKVRRDIFDDIAKAMGLTRDQLMNPETPKTGK